MMKKIIALLLFVCQLSALLSQNPGNKKNASDTSRVPAFIQEKFTKEYPAITPSWVVDGKNYKAFYTDPETNMSQLIVYDRHGNVLRRESELDKLAYPPAIGEYHSENFPGETYKLFSVEDKTGVNGYYSQHNSEVLHFDKNGNYVMPKEQPAKSNTGKK